MWAAIKQLFGFSSVVESATKIVDKIAGTDWMPQQKADFLLKYMEATKHQSVARRFIAISIIAFWLVLGITWLTASIIGRFAYDTINNPAMALASDISGFLALNINENLALVMMFYFGVHGVTMFGEGLRKRKE